MNNRSFTICTKYSCRKYQKYIYKTHFFLSSCLAGWVVIYIIKTSTEKKIYYNILFQGSSYSNLILKFGLRMKNPSHLIEIEVRVWERKRDRENESIEKLHFSSTRKARKENRHRLFIFLYISLLVWFGLVFCNVGWQLLVFVG